MNRLWVVEGRPIGGTWQPEETDILWTLKKAKNEARIWKEANPKMEFRVCKYVREVKP